MREVAEMTMTFGGMEPIPSYPWSPDDIMDLDEMERKAYLEALRDQRQAMKPKK